MIKNSTRNYGVGAVISPYIMSLALKSAKWNQAYQWTSYIQLVILLVCVLSMPLWKQNEQKDAEEENRDSAAVIGLQMASAYIGSTLMPMVFGHLQ